MASGLLFIILLCFGVTLGILAIIFIAVPVFAFIGKLIGGFFTGVGLIFARIFQFIGGMISDTLRFIGSIIAMIVFTPLIPLNVVIGRWSGAGHFANALKREFRVAGGCLYRVCLRHPLRLLFLERLLEGVEQRVPEAVAAAPASEKLSRRTGQFDGYTIVGSLKGGGSGAKLYIAKPDPGAHRKPMPDLVVIKSFAIQEGSTLPQIVRESRALECAKQIGLVLDHDMDERRFFYVMPYHPGDHLGIVTRDLHARTEGRGLEHRQLTDVIAYADKLLRTLAVYHRNGLWHKDVKPDNIIIHNNESHLVDLGLVTPLRSAMTLTTHGTEYFRDPEMVRQALKGRKVHQVDGTKFDLYAAGAVLYFMLENTFPAHGGLSRFSKKSPEALRWVVRRAMTDYDQRYPSAEAMLSDLQVIAAADDPYDVKPAALPSMSGDPIDLDLEDEDISFVAHAATPRPRGTVDEVVDVVNAAAEVADGADEEHLKRATDVGFHVGPVFVGMKAGLPRKDKKPRTSPAIRVTNWWTGAYESDTPGATPASNRALRREMKQVRRDVAADPASHRAPARDQRRNARKRVKDRQRRARTSLAAHRKAAPSNAPGIVVGIICLLALLAVGAIITLLVSRADHPRANGFALRGVGNQPLFLHDDDVLLERDMVDRGRALLLVTDFDTPVTEDMEDDIVDAIEDHMDDDYDVLYADFPWTEAFRDLYLSWTEDPNDRADFALEELLEDHDLFGVLHIYERDGRVRHQRIESERRQAQHRRWYRPEILEGGRYLLVNEYDSVPVKDDVALEAQRLLDRCTAAGATLVKNDALEPEFRIHLPRHAEDAVPPVLHTMIARHNFDGVIRVFEFDSETRRPAAWIISGEHDRVGATVSTSTTATHPAAKAKADACE